MDNLKRAAGALLFGYAILYSAQVLFHDFYQDQLDPQTIWDVFNVITAVGILIAVAAALDHWRNMPGDADSVRRLAANAGVYASVALALLFFPLWFSLLIGETPSDAKNVGWLLVSVINPLVLGTAGIHLWRASEPE